MGNDGQKTFHDDMSKSLLKLIERSTVLAPEPQDALESRLKIEELEKRASIERTKRTHCFMLTIGAGIFLLFAGLIIYYAMVCSNERMVEKVMGYLISTSAAILSYLAGTKK